MTQKKLVIFGDGEIAELAWFYFTNDSAYEVVGFVVDDAYRRRSSLFEKPVIGLSQLDATFPATDHSAFIALSYSRMNEFRRERYEMLKNMGYPIASYISSRCTNFALSLGENCFILEDNTIQPFVTIGHNVTLWSGNHIGHHSMIESHNFLASHIVVSGGVHIEDHCFIGVNATLRDHIRVKHHTLVGMAAILTRDTEPFSVYRVSGSRPDPGLKSMDIRI